jgi:hypothetical protein
VCWIALEQAGRQTVEPCSAYKHSPPGRQFYTRAMLDEEHRRLFVHIR